MVTCIRVRFLVAGRLVQCNKKFIANYEVHNVFLVCVVLARCSS